MRKSLHFVSQYTFSAEKPVSKGDLPGILSLFAGFFVEHLDKRWIFLVVALAVLVPLLLPLKIPMPESKPTRDFYRHIEECFN